VQQGRVVVVWRLARLLVLGCVLAVVVAWACQVLSPWPENGGVGGYFTQAGETYGYGTTNRFGSLRKSCSWVNSIPAERTRVRNGWPSYPELPAGAPVPGENESRIVQSCGWPFAAMRSDIAKNEITRAKVGGGGVLYLGVMRMELPYYPTWGLAANTVLYAAVLQVLMIATERSRGWWRQRRGRCAACNYDRRGIERAAACPECGAAS
jgi:hypothetical protein